MKIILIAIISFSTAVFAKTDELGLEAVKKILPCSPSLVSHWIQEKGFAKSVSTTYGSYEFIRTDVGDPDGKLTVKNDGKSFCEIELSLNPDIYFSPKIDVMVLSSYSGSSDWYEIYEMKSGKCKLLGKTTENSKSIREIIAKHDYDSRVCRKD